MVYDIGAVRYGGCQGEYEGGDKKLGKGMLGGKVLGGIGRLMRGEWGVKGYVLSGGDVLYV